MRPSLGGNRIDVAIRIVFDRWVGRAVQRNELSALDLRPLAGPAVFVAGRVTASFAEVPGREFGPVAPADDVVPVRLLLLVRPRGPVRGDAEPSHWPAVAYISKFGVAAEIPNDLGPVVVMGHDSL